MFLDQVYSVYPLSKGLTPDHVVGGVDQLDVNPLHGCAYPQTTSPVYPQIQVSWVTIMSAPNLDQQVNNHP
jgi:hypothetical protein